MSDLPLRDPEEAGADEDVRRTARDRLSRLAVALDCSVADFYAETDDASAMGLAALLQVWDAITDEADRERVLICARRIAAGHGDRARAGA